jgi:hypothetical protein
VSSKDNSLVVSSHRACRTMEVLGEAGSLKEATGNIEFELTIVLASIDPQVNGVDGLGVSREESGSDNSEGRVVHNTVHDTLVAVLSSGGEVVPSTSVLVAVLDELSSH